MVKAFQGGEGAGVEPGKMPEVSPTDKAISESYQSMTEGLKEKRQEVLERDLESFKAELDQRVEDIRQAAEEMCPEEFGAK